MDVETYSEVFSSPLPQRGSAVFLLQTDQNFVLWFGHIKHILQQEKKKAQMFNQKYLFALHQRQLW